MARHAALIALLLALAACQGKSRQVGIDDAVEQTSRLDAARLNVSDGSLYQPALRVLEDGRRLRLIVQDPLTHHYVLVR